MTLLISDQAVDDLTDVWTFIARDNVAAADRFLDKLHALCAELARSPGIGRKREELLQGVRSLPAGRYLVFYRVHDDTVEIVRVLSAYRDLDSVF